MSMEQHVAPVDWVRRVMGKGVEFGDTEVEWVRHMDDTEYQATPVANKPDDPEILGELDILPAPLLSELLAKWPMDILDEWPSTPGCNRWVARDVVTMLDIKQGYGQTPLAALCAAIEAGL